MLNFFLKRSIYKCLFSYRNYFYESLKSRCLVEVTGVDSKIFIQGLITNDIYSLGNSHGSIYSLFLNAKGRVLFDVIFYGNIKNRADDLLYIDCDIGAVDKLVKHLNIYKLRKQVKINRVNNAGLFAIMPENKSELLESLKTANIQNDKLVYFGSDPRIKSWILRCIGTDESVGSILPNLKPAPPNHYLISRLGQGICEGIIDFPLGVTLPLEYNADILNGISFNKGCYIGQELTARTHFTGVVRKRIMPVQFDVTAFPKLHDLVSRDQPINLLDQKGTSVGQLKTVNEAGLGLAVIRLSSLGTDTSSHENDKKFAPVIVDGTDYQMVIKAPSWWPSDIILPNCST